jgi:hypothetical protein
MTTPAQRPVAQPHRRGSLSRRSGQAADARLKWQVMERGVVVAVTNGRQDGIASLTRIFGSQKRIF